MESNFIFVMEVITITIYNSKAIDYSQGVVITDYQTGQTYTHEEALKQSSDIKSRLICRPVKIGCFVFSIKEADEIMKKRRKENGKKN